jgi:prepilin-type N-terminal cleavage/methylation domain-containing protein
MKKAFTLMELLIVISIIAVLMGIGVPTFFRVKEQAIATKTKMEVKNLELSLNSYLDVFRAWPSDWGDGELGGKMLESLRGDNPRKIVFYETKDCLSIKMYDPFASSNSPTGEMDKHVYQVMLDKDYDNKISVGDEVVRKSVVVWSPGIDGMNEYGHGDDIASWK